jgi:mono/diheme cytochrome c family protein/uncharacterized cupredoxin-like copper-binding protein
MSDERTGRELAPREEETGVSRAGEVTPVPAAEQLSVERFSAGPRMHSVGLTEERSAQVVRQSGNARNIAFLAVLIVSIFIPIYWFYDIGVPALGVGSRQAADVAAQQVTDVSQGYALFLANCARCHGPNGQGGIGPPLNDQNKLYNAVTADGLAGKGHLNPTYITTVLTVGGRYVCGDPNSLMPVWAQPGGPLNYRQIEELVAWLTASKDTTFTYLPATSELGAGGPAPTPVTVSGWRDPAFSPPPGASPPPACWRNPSGTIGGAAGGAQASAAPITSPGTAANPRVIALTETASITITDASGNPVSAVPVKAGETVEFDVDNKAGFPHNFYIGPAADLQSANTANLKGVPDFPSGVQKVTYTVPTTGTLQFACIVSGHYQTMHGDLTIQP